MTLSDLPSLASGKVPEKDPQYMEVLVSMVVKMITTILLLGIHGNRNQLSICVVTYR